MNEPQAFQLKPQTNNLAVGSAAQIQHPQLRTILTMSDAFMHLSELTKKAGYDFFLLGHPPEEGCEFKSADLLLSNLPLFVTEDLIALDLFKTWDVMTHFQKTSAPFVWKQDEGVLLEDQPFEVEKDNAKNASCGTGQMLQQHLNIQFAHCLPAATKGKRRAFLMLFSCNEEVDALDPALFLGFQKLFDQIETLTTKRSRNTTHELNDRELECLKWAAAGKTSSEIATIISLSEHTINHYLNSSCRKMDCVNRTQAVAMSIRLRMIQ